MKIFNGNIGKLETSQIKVDLDNLLSDANNSILLICMNSNNKKILSEIFNSSQLTIITFNELTNDIIKKNLLNVNVSRISDFIAIQIISSIMQEKFVSHKVMKNLCKSDYFARELYNLFGLFKVNNITYEDLSKILVDINISGDDKQRFKLVIEIYKTYQDKLEKDSLMDYKDIVIKCFDFLKDNKNLQLSYLHKYSHIFVENAQNLTTLQLNLIRMLGTEDNIFLYGDKNAQIQTFMGANAFVPEFYDYSRNIKNNDILKRALFIKNKMLDSEKSDSIEYREYSDLQEEIDFIANDIISQVKNGHKYSEFVILLRDNSLKNTILELLDKYKIPTNIENYNEHFHLFKAHLIRILNLCEVLEKLDLKSFSVKDFLNIIPKSKVDFNLYIQQFNLLFANILNSEIENKFLIAKLEKTNENSIKKILYNTILENTDMFSICEKEIFENIEKELVAYYEYFKQGNYVNIISMLVKKLKSQEKNYNILVAKFLSNVVEICEFNKNSLNRKTSVKTILDILNSSFEEVETSKNAVNILNFVNCAGLNFYRVYIPSLIENYFPKKIKSTHFISDEANAKLSDAIKSLNPNFEKIILSQAEEVAREENLLYAGLLTAQNKVILSTHKFEQKKQVASSSFFEQLKYVDGQNYIDYKKDKKEVIDFEEEYIEKDVDNKEEAECVIDKNKVLNLSASAISLFLNCPLRFYYKRLLGLKEESSFSANYGTLVHAIFELLFKKYLKEFSKQKVFELANVIFDVKNQAQNALKIGFCEDVVNSVLNVSQLELDEMYKYFIGAVEDLDAKNFFGHKIINAECEKSFAFNLDEIPNVTFIGKIDVILEKDNKKIIVDYKTGKNKSPLNYLFSEEGVNFVDGHNNFSLARIKKYDYQIPIYYFASQNAQEMEKHQDISEIGYQYVRPVSKNKDKNGSISDFISIENAEMYKDKIIENLKEQVVDKIYDAKEFLPEINFMTCQNCGFKEVCSKSNGENDE